MGNTGANGSTDLDRRQFGMITMAAFAAPAVSGPALANQLAETTGATRQRVIMVPGTFSDQVQFRHQVAGLADIADVTVSMRHAMHETMDGLAQGILRDAPERFAIIGLSLGGRAAFEVWRQAPERVTHIGFMASTPEGGTSEARERVAKMARELGYETMVDRMIPMLVPPPILAETDKIAEIKAMLLRAGAEVSERQGRASATGRSYWDSLAEIKIPALFICGMQDRIAKCEVVARAAKACPKGMLVEIDNCGHLPSMEHPEKVTDAMRAWLKAT